MVENGGASFRPKAKRPASHHGEHTQRTQATAWAEQYPRFTGAMQRQGILSRGEASSAVSRLKAGQEDYGEAVLHYGGVKKLARDAFRNRNLGRR
jgi:hypothetical protein